mmetsp:Transcript_38147/g.59517  ORF Transcript_38147/g.59517 Transcript_38147/m.59517 type:complete len:252 (+) Transcript_38147:152-907(+)
MTLSRALMIHNNKLVDPQRHSRVAGSETFSAPDATEAGSRFVSSDAEEATVRHLGGPFISETVTLGSDDLALVIDPQRAVRDMAKELVFRYGTNDVADFVPAYDLQKQRRPQLETIGSKPGSADRFFDNLVCSGKGSSQAEVIDFMLCFGLRSHGRSLSRKISIRPIRKIDGKHRWKVATANVPVAIIGFLLTWHTAQSSQFTMLTSPRTFLAPWTPTPGMFYNKIVETMQQGHAKDDGVDDKFSKLLLPF